MMFEMIDTHGYVQNLGWTLLHSLWQGALVALLYASTLAIFRGARAGARYAAGVCALVLMLAAPVVTFLYLNAASSASASEGGAATVELAAASVDVGQSQEVLTEEYGRQPHELGGAEISATSKPAPLQEWAGSRVEPVLGWLVLVWLAGMSVQALRLFGGWRAAERLKRQGNRPLGSAWEESLARLRRQLRISCAVRLCESALVEVPTLVGWLKPVVLVPASALAGLSTEQLEALIAHELAHVRRHDYLVNLLQTLAEALLFYHPAVWWISREVRQEREHACDDLAVSATQGGAIAYARALADLEQLRASDAVSSVALAADGGSLLFRIRRLVGAPAPARSARLAPLAASALMFIVSFALITGARESIPVASASADDATGTEAAPHASGRTLAVTFVSAPTFRPARIPVETLNRMTKKLLSDMAEHKIKAVGFVGEGQLGDYDNRVREARINALRAWLDAGHELGSQTYRHMNLYNTPLAEWKENAVRGEALLTRLLAERGKKLRYFSYPYLNTGPDEATKKAAAEWLGGRGYTIHPVTIDHMDWLFAQVHQEALRRGDTETAEEVAAEFVPYMERMLEFYEGLSRDVFGREIPQVLMLTTSPLVADQFDELVSMLKRRGYAFVTLDEATKDEAYSQPETYAGEWGVSWLQRWAHTKFGEMRQEPYLPPYMRQYSKREGIPPAERKHD